MTGFNWSKYEAWRRHPMLNNNLRFAVPGIGYGAAAFAVYVVYDKVFGAKEEHH